MSRRLRQRREAIESRYVAMHSDDDDEADWEDADFDSLAVYREAESTNLLTPLAGRNYQARVSQGRQSSRRSATITPHGQALQCAPCAIISAAAWTDTRAVSP